MSKIEDPFGKPRREEGSLECTFQGEKVPMILRHEAVRAAAKDWKTFSSDAPFRVPIPSEEDVRTVRQLPIETDPPDHTEYRDIVEPIFHRAKDPRVAAQVGALVDELLAAALRQESVEVVREFALPLQSRALALLLNVPRGEADTWIEWGIHVFHDGGSGTEKGATLERYLRGRIERAIAAPGDDLFGVLATATFRGRRLTPQEMMGFANLTFAGGRDTIIHTVSSVCAYFGRHPEALEHLRKDPSRVVHACEEFFRALSPLTHIGRVCPVDTEVNGFQVKAGGRVSLCWASANQDEKAFDAPGEVRLDRRPNPHVAFGFGPHVCIGAPHARLVLRTLVQKCAEQLAGIRLLDEREHVEEQASYQRSIGFDSLRVRFLPLLAEAAPSAGEPRR